MLATIHSWWTVALLVVFVGIVIWAFSSKRKADFDAASRLPLEDDDRSLEARRRPRNGDVDG